MSKEDVKEEKVEKEVTEPETEKIDEEKAVDERDALIESLQSEVAKLKNDFARAYADTENMKKRLTKEADNAKKYRFKDSALELLPIVDNMAMALNVQTEDDIEEITKKAEAGDADAQYILGIHYEFGEAVRKSALQAAKWFRLAAEQGHVKALNSMGYFYRDGVGRVRRNLKRALQCWIKSARAGNPQAYLNLAETLQAGLDLPPNLPVAYVLCKASGLQETVGAETLKAITSRMKFSEIDEAEKMSAEEALQVCEQIVAVL